MTTNNQDLQRKWEERVRAGTYSAGVMGLGTMRIMGKSGDAALLFPRIASLDGLPTLEPDEQWAVRQAEAALVAAQIAQRTVFNRETSEVLRRFDPSVSEMLVVSRIAGGR